MWELWKRRNSHKYGEVVTISRVIYQVSTTLQSLVKVRKPTLQNVPHRWPDLIQKLEQYTLALKVTKVIWEFPTEGWIKVNTDGASRGNPERSSVGYVLRDEEGDVIFTLGREIPQTTNNEVETIVILEAMRYCVGNCSVLNGAA
uniref:RNase H type-1 domain-containing protein n=1 Tax=Nicotiana tabacum TaxID=4097 RepID=A0A1S3YUP0_TOBAC|nr:PREDICTED: uncharacterized protein LOC107780002 [Nicotiana tabacum]